MIEHQQLGKYKLEEHLGSGAYADVYRATDTTLKRTVALKVLKPMLLADEEAFARFVQEAQTAAGLFHPHIATVLDLGEAEGRYFLAMRYVNGPSLDKLLAERGPLPWSEALRITEEIAEALQFAHDKGLIHRDVKPGNILVSESEGAVLTDFGLVKAMHASGMTATGSFLGTPHYMAPEIWKGEQVSSATDQYALACILAELLSGQVLYDGMTPPAVMAKHFQPPTLPVKWPAHISVDLATILRRSLAQNSKKRFDTLKQFISSLQAPRRTVDESNIPKGKTKGRGLAIQGDVMAITLGKGKLIAGVVLELVRIPAGPFLMGSNVHDQYTKENEQPQHEIHLEEYWMGITPVTVAQFETFVRATGYKTTAETEGSNNWKSAARGKPDHPVTYVSWHDGLVFCDWASKETGLEIILPSEAQWEKAARGADGRTWPWGNQAPDNKRCNFDNNIKDTSPVSNYIPAGVSPFGCDDMAGNVWEWTSTLYKDYPYRVADGREDMDADGARVMRGGAFDYFDVSVRCAYRSWFDPNGTYNNCGFRASAPPPLRSEA